MRSLHNTQRPGVAGGWTPSGLSKRHPPRAIVNTASGLQHFGGGLMRTPTRPLRCDRVLSPLDGRVRNASALSHPLSVQLVPVIAGSNLMMTRGRVSRRCGASSGAMRCSPTPLPQPKPYLPRSPLPLPRANHLLHLTQCHDPRPPHRAGGWNGTPTHASTSSALGSAPWSCANGMTWRLCLPLAGLQAGQ
ncbi:hypothetical protein HaLaN_04307 [Haematococcus lacustris]|uniref:Uncharacterized protein n=1 Tax=Haematococcus lacustris TaxID=44745 RepID=A0A699YQM8_HAELA|nr:hypothetical protein HaLaN_04307 [Haematococcus lacustris]